MLIGFAYSVPPVLTCMALTRQGAPVPLGTTKGTGVLAGSGVPLAVVAVTPSPTKM
jgi:hypothetical protein